jgi:hypothetical protein
MRSSLIVLAGVLLAITGVDAQRRTCPPEGWGLERLQALKRDGFKVPDAASRYGLALALPECLGHPSPDIRDGIAFEALAAWMRAEQLDLPTLVALRTRLLDAMTGPDVEGFTAPFAALVLAEVARTDRIKPWMSAADRDALVRSAALFLARVKDYRAFDDREGYRHGVAHGADFVLQLALNPAINKAQLDHLLPALASQVAPDADVAYWAGEPERLARAVIFIAQRNLHADSEWKAFLAEVTSPRPLSSWKVAFASERGIKKRHNVRAFLLSVLATAMTSEDPGIRRLAAPVRDALTLVQ